MVALRRSREASPKTFSGVKVFSATMYEPRQHLGETVTAWIAAHPEFAIIDIVQTQSSDSAFHCLSVTLFYAERPTKTRATRRAPEQ